MLRGSSIPNAYGSDTAQANGLPFNPFNTCSPNSRTSNDEQVKLKPSEIQRTLYSSASWWQGAAVAAAAAAAAGRSNQCSVTRSALHALTQISGYGYSNATRARQHGAKLAEAPVKKNMPDVFNEFSDFWQKCAASRFPLSPLGIYDK